ncbi:acetyltransferase [Escherichia coli]|uniref:Acetyltransferase n=1 Tax=Escherichia coli TaxID=562 RepID=A0A376P184_ECOLX|nr:acetyltransferase [Escherichia coli]
MVDKHEEITLPIVLSCNYQSDITYPGQKQFDCGNPVIDKFVRASLKKSVRNSDCAAKALIDRQSGELIGICTLRHIRWKNNAFLASFRVHNLQKLVLSD